jgi:hypothetical protein
MASPPELHDLACVVHLHSTYSDGTGTVPQIAAAGRRAGADVVLLTDHDTLEAKRRGEEGWYGSTLVLVGEEVSPPDQNHYLAFGVDEEVDRFLPPADICAAVEAGGGFGFAAHPFSAGSKRFKRGAAGMPWRDLDCLHGLELWSFVTDTAERIDSVRDALRFILLPGRFVDHPPARNLAVWDRLCEDRRVVAIGGLDAHQFGVRIGGRVPLRLMAYARSFRHLRTHVLCERALAGEVTADREQVYHALRAGRCYLAMDSLAPASGFAFWAESDGTVLSMGTEIEAGDGAAGWTLRARTPVGAALRLLRDGQVAASTFGGTIDLEGEGRGVYRVEARLRSAGRDRTWILSNPIYIR